jgi:DNA topoisomerase-1
VRQASTVSDLETKPTKKKKKSPTGPFTLLLYSKKRGNCTLPVGITMQLAQRLYEAGLITYMRTDSVNLSKEAMDAAQAEIIKSYGKEFSKPRTFTNKSKELKKRMKPFVQLICHFIQ